MGLTTAFHVRGFAAFSDESAYTMEASIGPHRIFEPLGQGGMGIVYQARHLTSEQPVALKTVKVPTPTLVR
jgi:serine/threonine protein kinase